MTKLRIAVLIATVSAGCAAQGLDAGQSLAGPVKVSVAGQSSINHLSFTVSGPFAGASSMTLAVGQPALTLESAGGASRILALSMPLPDIEVTAKAMPPNGLKLRHVSLHGARAPAAIIEAAPDALELHARMPLSVSWSLELGDGSLYPLGDVASDPVDVDVRVVRNDGEALAIVQTHCLGTCWSIDGVAQLSNAELFVQGDAAIATAN
jgi:hypothetical protein